MNIMDLVNFVRDYWDKIILIITTTITIVQAFQIKVLKKG